MQKQSEQLACESETFALETTKSIDLLLVDSAMLFHWWFLATQAVRRDPDSFPERFSPEHLFIYYVNRIKVHEK